MLCGNLVSAGARRLMGSGLRKSRPVVLWAASPAAAVQIGVQIKYHPPSQVSLPDGRTGEDIGVREGETMNQEDLSGREGEPQTPMPPPLTPPIEPGPLARPAGYSPYASPVPVWPTVIGVLGIVLGSLGLLGGIWGAVAPIVMKTLFQNTAMDPNMPQFTERWIHWTVILSVLTSAVAVLLIVAGAGILKRAAWSPRAARIWAVLKMVLVIANLVVTFEIQRSALAAATQAGGPGMTVNANLIMIPSLCFGLLWGWALPVFLLIWFSRASIKEQVSKWT